MDRDASSYVRVVDWNFCFHYGVRVMVGGVEVVHWLVNGFEDPCFYIEISQSHHYKIKYTYVLPRGSIIGRATTEAETRAKMKKKKLFMAYE